MRTYLDTLNAKGWGYAYTPAYGTATISKDDPDTGTVLVVNLYSNGSVSVRQASGDPRLITEWLHFLGRLTAA